MCIFRSAGILACRPGHWERGVSWKCESSNGICGKHDKTWKNWHDFHVWFQLCNLMLHAPSGKRNVVNFNISQAPWDYGGSFHFPNWWRTLNSTLDLYLHLFCLLWPPQGWQPQITMFWCDWILIYEFHQLQLVGYLGGIPWSQTSLRSLQTHLKIIKVPFGMLMVPSTPWPPEMKTSYFVPQKTNFRVMVSDQSTTSKKKKVGGWQSIPVD